MSNLPTIFTDSNDRKLLYEESSSRSLEKRILKLLTKGCRNNNILLVSGKNPIRASLEDYSAEFDCDLFFNLKMFPLDDILEGKKRDMLHVVSAITEVLSKKSRDRVGIFFRMPAKKLAVITNILSPGKWNITRVFGEDTLRLISSSNFISSLLSRSN